MQPKDITKTDPSPLPDSEPVPVPSPDTTETPTDKEVQDFCEKNPDVLACQTVTLGTLEPDEVADTKKDLSIDRGPSMGPSAGSCPAPKTVTVMGVTLSMPFTLLCDFAVMINPLLIGFAWLSAALTFFGLGRRES